MNNTTQTKTVNMFYWRGDKGLNGNFPFKFLLKKRPKHFLKRKKFEIFKKIKTKILNLILFFVQSVDLKI